MDARPEFAVVGKGVPVKDAIEKVTGSLKYAVDFGVQGMVHGKILRSPHSHARVVRVDARKAEAVPGVLGILTAEDTPGKVWDGCWFNYRGKVLDEKVRFVGDEVAAVAALTEEIAEAAIELIEVEYDVLPAAITAKAALADDAPEIREEGNARSPYRVEWGDIAKAEEQSDHVIEADIDFSAQQALTIGRNACVAEWNGDRVTVWTSSQTPSELRLGLSQALDIPQSRVRVISFPTGSSFGLWWSNNFMMITALLAKKVRKPVKIELSNAECIATVKRRHKENSRGRIGFTNDGTIKFVEVEHLMDNGGYGFKNDVGFFVVDTWSRIENGSCTVQGVSTNTVTAGCMRGVGDVTLGAFLERLCDMAAAKLNRDPVEFRLQNQIKSGEPLRHVMGQEIPEVEEVMRDPDRWMAEIPQEMRDSMPVPFLLAGESTDSILRRCSEEFGWKDKWVGWGKPYAVNGPKRRAVGVGTGVSCCGVEFEGNVGAVLRLNSDGSAKLHCAAGRQGQGSETTLCQVAAEALGIPFEKVEIETGDTDSCPWAHGSLASNTMYRVGWAAREAATDARRQLLELAAREHFDVDPSELTVKEGRIGFKNASGGRNLEISIEEAMNSIRKDALGQMSSITGRPSAPMVPTTTFARHFAAHFVEVEVDEETGEIQLLDYVAGQESGTVVNPQVLKNQAIGGAICGAGYGLYEGLVFDESTGEVLNAGLLDYKVLRTADFPAKAKVIFGESYDPVGPFGASAAGEAPIGAPIPAIAQAVYNAIGVWIDVPMTPERVLKALGRI